MADLKLSASCEAAVRRPLGPHQYGGVPNVPRFVVDGQESSDPDSPMVGDGMYPPFRIFEPDWQEYVPGNYATREQAEAVCERMNAVDTLAGR